MSKLIGGLLGSVLLLTAACSSSTPAAKPGTSAGTTAPTTRVVPSTVSRSTGTAGPVANVDHWHGAYGVFDCDKYLPPIDGSELPDPDGIHTHADGLIHIHPFTERGAGDNARLTRFAGVVGLTLTTDRLALGQLDRKTGDECPNGKPGRARLIQFTGPTHSDPVEVPEGLELRLQKDQVLAFVFAPEDQLIGPPPSLSELDAPRDAPITFEITPERRDTIGAEPIFALPPGNPPDELVIEDLEIGTGDEVGSTSKVGIKYVIGTYSSNGPVDSNWVDQQALLGLAVGRGMFIEGFDKGIAGMKVGGLRRLTIPPALGFGAQGLPPRIGPNETLVMYIRLVAVEQPRFDVGSGAATPS
jgi:peptidylprolyl isomerase